MTLTQPQGEALWDQLHEHLIDAERVMVQIIEKRAFLGFDSFAEAWTSRNMSDITLAAEIRPHVVYALLDGGLTTEEVASQVKGIGRDRAESLARQKGNGVPASDASLAVKRDPSLSLVTEHVRQKSKRRGVLALEFGYTKIVLFESIAKYHNLSVREIAQAAVEEKFKELS